MQQLTLFNEPYVERRKVSTRSRKNKMPQPGSATLNLWSQQPEAEKEMALFFLDIRNFTTLVGKHHATDVIHIVRKLFSRFQHVIRLYHGRIIETSGDGFYAAFGFDHAVMESVRSAVHAGMAILNVLDHLNVQTFERTLHQRVDVGIGVHVGKVAVGNIRLGSQNHLVVMGHAVNVASRLQNATKELNNNFIVSSDVFNLLSDSGVKGKSVSANLKGVVEPCELHLIGRAYAA